MPIDRVGIGPARPCMLMCERTSVSPPRVSASIAHKRSYECTRAQYVCTHNLYPMSTLRREIRACERTRARQVSRYSYLRAIALERNFCQTYLRYFLIRGCYRYILTLKEIPNMKLYKDSCYQIKRNLRKVCKVKKPIKLD